MTSQAKNLIDALREINLTPKEKQEIIRTLGLRKNNASEALFTPGILTNELTADLLNKTILDLKEKQEELAAANEELARQKQEIEIKNRELTEQYQQLEQFSYVASHDLKSPLRTISNFASLLQKRYKNVLDTEADEFLDFIVTGTRNMNQVICDLLDYSRLGVKKNDFSDVNLMDILDLVKFNLSDEIRSNQVHIVVEQLPTLQANKSSMIQLFQNLIGNAIKFRREGVQPKINIAVAEHPKHWSITISDNGVGMDEKFKNKAFQPFQRLNNQDRPGTGMGLAICKKAVKLHGGDINFESKLDEGTTFSFTLQKLNNPIDKRKASLLDSN